MLAAARRAPPGPALALAQRAHGRLGRRDEIGLCWFISARRKRPRVVWHPGGTWGFRSFAAFSPESHTAAIVLSNAARSVNRVGLGLVDAG